VPPATSGPDLGAGGRKAKEPLFAAALSLILPGTGQVYNGQMAKGLVLAAVYLGSIAIIFGGMVIVALGAIRNSNAGSACCCCLPLLVVPLAILVYAIYDAYHTADNINFNKPVKEWP
jgi:TM2 domain-containing membrane protein YozV